MAKFIELMHVERKREKFKLMLFLKYMVKLYVELYMYIFYAI